MGRPTRYPDFVIGGLIGMALGGAAVFILAPNLFFSGGTAPDPGRAPRAMTADVSFEECQERIRQVAARHGVPPVTVVDSELARIVRFYTRDGSVLITCSRRDGKVLVTIDPN